MSESREPEVVLRELLETIANALGLDATVEIAADEDSLTGTVHGEDLGVFVGRHGQTIDAVQHLAQRIILTSNAASSPRRIVVDAGDYRARRREALQKQADQAAIDAERYDRPVALDAMTASERRYVHEYLRERGGVDTHSEGTEPDRHLVVTALPAR